MSGLPLSTDPTSVGSRPRVTILLATYNGATYLNEQLQSYLAQTDIDWDLWVSDDGSTDGTRALLDDFARAHGTQRDIRILNGPRKGAAANFFSLLTHPDLPTSYPVALSDQDDVWLPAKLSHAMAVLKSSDPVTLYSGQSYHTNADLAVTGNSIPPRRAPSFGNALLQNIVSGHSMVISTAGLALVRRAGVPADVPYHDWWLYQLFAGAGGQVKVDTAQMIYYRQHGTNALGAHDGVKAGLARFSLISNADYGRWIDTNLAALSKVNHLLTPASQTTLQTLQSTPKGIRRALAMRILKIRRQSFASTIIVYLASAIGWI